MPLSHYRLDEELTSSQTICRRCTIVGMITPLKLWIREYPSHCNAQLMCQMLSSRPRLGKRRGFIKNSRWEIWVPSHYNMLTQSMEVGCQCSSMMGRLINQLVQQPISTISLMQVKNWISRHRDLISNQKQRPYLTVWRLSAAMYRTKSWAAHHTRTVSLKSQDCHQKHRWFVMGYLALAIIQAKYLNQSQTQLRGKHRVKTRRSSSLRDQWL